MDISTKIYHHIHKSDKTSKNGVWCLVLTSPRPILDDLVYFCEYAQIFFQRGLSSLHHIFHFDPVLHSLCGPDGLFWGQENSLLKLFALCLWILHLFLPCAQNQYIPVGSCFSFEGSVICPLHRIICAICYLLVSSHSYLSTRYPKLPLFARNFSERLVKEGPSILADKGDDQRACADIT